MFCNKTINVMIFIDLSIKIIFYGCSKIYISNIVYLTKPLLIHCCVENIKEMVVQMSVFSNKADPLSR